MKLFLWRVLFMAALLGAIAGLGLLVPHAHGAPKAGLLLGLGIFRPRPQKARR